MTKQEQLKVMEKIIVFIDDSLLENVIKQHTLLFDKKHLSNFNFIDYGNNDNEKYSLETVANILLTNFSRCYRAEYTENRVDNESITEYLVRIADRDYSKYAEEAANFIVDYKVPMTFMVDNEVEAHDYNIY